MHRLNQSNAITRVVVDECYTTYVSINRDVPQGTVLGADPLLDFVNDIKAVNPGKNLQVKFADDITLSIPIKIDVTPHDL